MSKEFEDKVIKCFENIDKRFENIDKRFEKMDEKFENIDKRFEKMGEKFENIDKRFEKMDEKFENIDKKFDNMDKRFDNIENTLQEHGKILNEHTRQINSLHESVALIEDKVMSEFPALLEAFELHQEMHEDLNEKIAYLSVKTEENSIRISALEDKMKCV